MSYLSDIKQILNCNDSYNTDIIPRQHFQGTILNWGNNGIGSRFARKKLNYGVLYKNKKVKIYSEYITDIIDEKEIETFFIYNILPRVGIVGIKVFGLRKQKLPSRYISPTIRNGFIDKRCVVCGTSNDIVIDHKDGLYIEEILSTKDFQVLCNHCNLVKRERYKLMKETNNIDSITSKTIPHLKIFCDIINEEYINNTFWYDPCAFTKRIADEFVKMKLEIKELQEIINVPENKY